MSKTALSLFALWLLLVSAEAFPEGAWLSSVPKTERAGLSAAFSATGALQKRLREDYSAAVRHEERFAVKARSLARAYDLAAEKTAAGLAALSGQRRLRWESARDLAEGRYGRAGKAGVETPAVLEKNLEKEGAAFAAALEKRLPKLAREALSAVAADLEARTAAHPDCPPAAFAELRAAAAALGAADRRRWILSLASGLPRAPLAVFGGRLGGEASAAASGPEALFAAALSRYRTRLDAAAALKAALPAAAAAAWHVDSQFAPPPAASAASFSSFAAALADADADAVSAALAEFPALDLAFSEFSALLWLLGTRRRDALKTDFGLDEQTVERSLRAAWLAKAHVDGDSPAAGLPVDLASVRAAERMAVFLEGEPDAARALGAFAALRADGKALFAFATGGRYAHVRPPLAEAFLRAMEEADRAAADPARPTARVGAGTTDVFGRILVAFRTAEGAAALPARFGPAYADSLAASLGLRADPKKKESAAALLAVRGVLFTVPALAGPSEPSAEELTALSDGTCFYPVAPDAAAAAAVRAELVRSRAAEAAARAGVPFRLVASRASGARYLAAFFSCAGRCAQQEKRKAAP